MEEQTKRVFERSNGSRINRNSWRIIEIILRRYPERKKEYEEYISDIMASSGSSGRLIDPEMEYNRPQSVTEAKALKMTSVYAEKIKKEIEAVEFVYNNLRPEEQKVIRIRYWSRPARKPVTYSKMPECSYSETQMKRIVGKTIKQIGKYIGEIQ